MKNPFDESGLVNVRQLNDDSKIDSLTLSSYPNPFNNRTNIVVNIKNPSFLNVYIYNILGQLVKVVAAADYVEGKKIYSWDGNSANNYSVSSGVYFIRLIAKEKNSGQSLSSIRKILLLK
jgi:flagellar hook assembly protein FlgD